MVSIGCFSKTPSFDSLLSLSLLAPTTQCELNSVKKNSSMKKTFVYILFVQCGWMIVVQEHHTLI